MFWGKGSGYGYCTAKQGFNLWKHEEGGFEFIVKVPLFLFKRNWYLSFDDYCLKTGWFAWFLMVYIRRRESGLVADGLSKWVFGWNIAKGSVGKQTVNMERAEIDDKIRRDSWYEIFDNMGGIFK